MSNSITITGVLLAGPQGVCEGGFPAGILQLAFGLAGSCPGAGTKPAAKKFWTNTSLNSPTAFVTLDGVGTGQTVTKATTLYVKTSAQVKFRLTMVDYEGGPDIVSILESSGLLITEFPDTGYLKLLEAKGLAGIEYVAAGNE